MIKFHLKQPENDFRLSFIKKTSKEIGDGGCYDNTKYIKYKTLDISNGEHVKEVIYLYSSFHKRNDKFQQN